MRTRILPLAVLVAAVAALAASAAWAFGRGGEGGWMTSRSQAGMMGLSAGGGGAPVRDIAAARKQAQRFADRLGLKTGEVLRFSRNYYVELTAANGAPVTEVLVDPATGSVWPEYGPAMMWNTRYGMMGGVRGTGWPGMMGGGTAGGMMGGGMMGGAGMGGAGMGGAGSAGMMDGPAGGAAAGIGIGPSMMGAGAGSPWGRTRTRAVSAAEARAIAQRWLDRSAPGLRAQPATRFPGYFTLETMRDGKVTGMLSVNAATGAIWPHWWHGRFVAMSA